MESLITAAARALEAGDPLGALNRVALRNDAPSLALRGIAMAQLGDLAKAKTLLRSAARAFGPKEAMARARCVVAEAEIALVSRDLNWPAKTLAAARAALVVDTFHHAVRRRGILVPLGRRPVLFALVRILAQAWPADVSREALITGAFQARHVDESHRARLRVEIGRLRTKLKPLADVSATRQGFALTPRKTRQVLVLARPVEEKHATVLALLSDGEPWSSSGLALALGTSARTVQRALEELARSNK